MLKVLAFDPGITTGIASGLITDDGWLEVGSAQERWSVSQIYQYLNEQQPDIVIYERFEYRNRTRAGVELFSRELIGIFKLYADQNPSVEVYAQMPAHAIGGYYSDKMLKELHVYKVGKPHANDATRHLLTWFTFREGYKHNLNGIRPS